jgi:DNA repair protein RadA/Sms
VIKKSPKPTFTCSNCGYTTTSWVGKCPQCGQWNTLLQDALLEATGTTKATVRTKTQITAKRATLSDALNNLGTIEQSRIQFASKPLQDFFSGGLASDSISLIAGEPGLGKSTFALQILKSALQHTPIQALYITAEESLEELSRRAGRLGVPGTLEILQTQRFETIEQELLTKKPQVVILDSIQTVYSSAMDSSPGSVAQITNIVTQLLSICKNERIALIIIGHVTKDGSIAGPRTLEHLVDTVLVMERTEQELLSVSFSKYRFGSTEHILFLKMSQSGLNIIQDVSLLLLENLEDGIGITYSVVRIKNQNIIVEIQALASKNFSGTGFQRQGIGVTSAKLNSIVAIIKKYLQFDLDSADIYVNLVGLPKGVWDESLDLAIVLAIISSYLNRPIQQLLPGLHKERPVFSGRITLSGTIRNATALELRAKTAQKLKLAYNPSIKIGPITELPIIRN